MYATLDLNYILKESEHNKKIINFSSAVLKGIANIPGTLLLILSVPLIIAMIPVLNLILYSTIKKMQKLVDLLNKGVSKMDYETVRKIYNSVSTVKPETITNDGGFVTGGLVNKTNKLFSLFKQLEKDLEKLLFVDTSNQPPLTEKEKEAFEYLNEVWGDDDDKVYAKATFNQLKKETHDN